ncbi:MAG: hypothetical protein EXS11_00280 [Gemmataceae bacterium]|nr:hypothetical protein [Gemmataceae bacterium]
MKHSETKTKHFKRWLWMPLFAGILFVGTGCKNASGGTGWPISAPAGVDPLMGHPPAIAPTAGVAPTGLAPAASPTGPVAGPLPAMHAPNSMGSPAALATGTTSMLSNPRDPLASNNNTSVPALSAPIPTSNIPFAPNAGINPGGSVPVLLNPVPSSNPNGGTPPPAFGSIPSGPLPLGGSAPPPPPDPVPGGSVSKLNPQGPIALAGLQQFPNQNINQASANVNTTTSQYNMAVQSNLTQLQDQLRQQGQTVDQATQTSLTNLNGALCQNGMVWQKMQKQTNGTWKSIASFSDPKNPTNRRTMEAVAATPEAALGALLVEIQAAR